MDHMNCKQIEVQLKDGKLPKIFIKSNLHLEDNILHVEDELYNVTYCFPMENVLYYQFKRE